MKTTSVSATSSATQISAAPSPAATVQSGTTDFMALFTQAMTESTAAGAASTTIAAAGLPFGTRTQTENAAGELDDSEVAALMTALAGVPLAAPIAAAAPSQERPVEASEARAAIGGILAGAVREVLAAQTAEVDASTAQPETSVEVLPTDSEPASSTTIDPRVTQTALEPARDVRPAHQPDAPVQRHMHSTVGTHAWREELGNQISWMTDRGVQAASLRLSPEHLGPLEIQVSIQDDQASVWFGAAHADTRAAIEGALPRLREMLASQGLALTDAGVFKESPRQQGQFGAERNATVEGAAAADGVQPVHVQRLGLVDAYA